MYLEGREHVVRWHRLRSQAHGPRGESCHVPPPREAPPSADGLDGLRQALARHVRLAGPVTSSRAAEVLGIDWWEIDAVVRHPWFDLEAGKVALSGAGWDWIRRQAGRTWR